MRRADSDLLYTFETADGRFIDAGASVHRDEELPLVFTEWSICRAASIQFGLGLEGNAEKRTRFRLALRRRRPGLTHEDDFIDANDQLVTCRSSQQTAAATVTAETIAMAEDRYPSSARSDVETNQLQLRRQGRDATACSMNIASVPLALNGARAYWMEYRRVDIHRHRGHRPDHADPPQPLQARQRPAIVNRKSAATSAR